MAKITLAQKNEKRKELYTLIKDFFEKREEDIDYCVKGDTKTAILNMPILIDNEEAWAEIMVSIPNKEDYNGYEKREDYIIASKEKAEKAKIAEEKKRKKIEKDKKAREEKNKNKEKNG